MVKYFALLYNGKKLEQSGRRGYHAERSKETIYELLKLKELMLTKSSR